jgi:alpha-beta hydrolase superfamily lysophospholipase
LLLHGTEDPVCDISGSHKFHAATSSMDKKFVQFPKGLHKLIIDIGKEEYIKEVVQWLTERSI